MSCWLLLLQYSLLSDWLMQIVFVLLRVKVVSQQLFFSGTLGVLKPYVNGLTVVMTLPV